MASNRKIWKFALPQTIALLAIVGTAAAAVTLTYSAASPITLGLKAAPVIYEIGTDGTISDYVTLLSLSTNKTQFTSTIKGVPEATVTMDDLIHVRNVDTRTHTVTLSTAQVTNALVTAYKVDFFDGVTNVGTLDLKTASPSVTFTNLAAAKILTGKVTLTYASGAGANNVADSRSIAIAVSS